MKNIGKTVDEIRQLVGKTTGETQDGHNKNIETNPTNSQKPEAPYMPPSRRNPDISHHPDDLIGDLRAASANRNATFTVEDKDPSILWQLNSDSFMQFWKNMMGEA